MTAAEKMVSQGVAEHAPPSSYMLRNLHDVPVPDGVSWWPQTLGWTILGAALVLLMMYWVYRQVWGWWQNRYRTEALAAIDRINKDPAMSAIQRGQALFQVLKVVMVYLDSRHSALFGQPFLQQLDRYCSADLSGLASERGFDNALGARWMESLVNPHIGLAVSDWQVLHANSCEWLKTHSPRRGRSDLQSAEGAGEEG